MLAKVKLYLEINFVARLIVDTGLLVALYIQGDTLHQSAIDFLSRNKATLITVTAVIVESSFFLNTRGKHEFLNWISRGGLEVIDLPVSAYSEIAGYINKYADQGIDFADAALVWLANTSSEREILTVDETDFSIYRLHGNKPFRLVSWY